MASAYSFHEISGYFLKDLFECSSNETFEYPLPDISESPRHGFFDKLLSRTSENSLSKTSGYPFDETFEDFVMRAMNICLTKL